MICIGIDPGAKGALAVLLDDGSTEIVPYDPERYIDALTDLYRGNGIRCCLEKVGAMPKQGVASTFKFGENFGLIQGILTAFGIPFQLVPPRTWKAEFGLNSDKARSIEVCKRLFPGVSLRASDRCRVDNDGMAEALLMAEYARRRM